MQVPGTASQRMAYLGPEVLSHRRELKIDIIGASLMKCKAQDKEVVLHGRHESICRLVVHAEPSQGTGMP